MPLSYAAIRHYDAVMIPKPLNSSRKPALPARLLISPILMVVGVLLASSCLQTWFSDPHLAINFVSHQTWVSIATPQARVSYTAAASVTSFVALVSWLAGAVCICRFTGQRFLMSATRLAFYGAWWWCLLDLWEVCWIVAASFGNSQIYSLLAALPPFWLAFCLSGWITTLVCLANSPSGTSESEIVASAVPAASTQLPTLASQPQRTRLSHWVWFACGLYIVIFTTMNWRLYFNLLVPHGDSAMYEEHLWNLLHGKGFRSYLDQGLFLGEHIQFVHLFLIPLYVLWPSHLLLELCESSALALGAFPVYWMTQRQTKSDRAALAAAVAYLLYSPMQFLDIEIDLKTFLSRSV